jgi:division protein CdvB (Snf7/Vps24/ESCRT-III family)
MDQAIESTSARLDALVARLEALDASLTERASDAAVRGASGSAAPRSFELLGEKAERRRDT